MAEIDSTGAGRHASWLELFFDLVMVASIVQLAHRLHGAPTARSIAVFLGLCLAVWVAWTSFTLYANVAGEGTRRIALLLGMLGIAVMAAAVPDATGSRAPVFAGAYVVVRILGQLSWAGTRQTLLAWPSVQSGFGLIPWVVSLAVDAPVRYVLWGVGLAVDVLVPIVVAGWTARVRRRLADDPAWRGPPEAHLDLTHLAERLGLFLIIVLGEGVLQLVTAAAAAPWTVTVVVAALGGFAMLIGLWWPTFQHGLVPTESGTMPVRLGLPLHFVSVASITGLAAGLGAIIEHPDQHAEPGVRWLLCGGLAIYFLTAAVGAVIIRQPWHWLLFWGLPGALLPSVLGVAGERLPGVLLVWVLVGLIAWQAAYVWRVERLAARR